jgi:prefoldin subunit 5
MTLRNDSPLSGARQVVSDRVKRLIDFRISERVPFDRIDHYCDRVDGLAHEHRESTEDLRGHLAELSGRFDELTGRFAELTRRFDEVDRLQRWSANELERVIPQVSAQESQLESLREKISAVPVGGRPEVDDARSLIDEIRREHGQIRVRLTAVAQYEDRLRSLENRSQ